MSVKVNLLPDEVRVRGEANRSRALAGLAGLVLVAILAGLTLLQRGSISDAQAELAQVTSQNQALQADIAALQPFADLEARADEAVTIVGLALGTEGSLATVLQDLSAVMPPTAQIDTLAVSLSPAPLTPATGGDRFVFGRLAASGKVLDGFAPGVERLMIDLERVAAFDNVYMTTSTVDEEGFVTFNIDAEFGPEVLTDRYVVDGTGGDQ